MTIGTLLGGDSCKGVVVELVGLGGVEVDPVVTRVYILMVFPY